MYQYPYLNPQSSYQFQNPKTEIIRVNGIEGAKAYMMSSNSSALLLDETNPIVYLKMTDGAGYPTITAYNITPYEQPQPVVTNINADYESAIKNLEQRISKLEGGLNNESNNQQSKSKVAKQFNGVS